MIIRIEDAPNIKHIKIDINFDDDGKVTPNVDINTVTRDSSGTPGTPGTPEKINAHKKSMMDDVALDMDETFEVSNEVVEKPVIPETIREVKVSEDMENLEF
jgi:hypothetical protein